MPHFKITLAYDGTPYHGWQIQPGLATVQGALADAIFRIARERVLPQGSGRTDTGVHALGQVASVTLAAPIPADRLHRALNHCLPNSIRILSAEQVPAHFHARHSAASKTYEYRIFPPRHTAINIAESRYGARISVGGKVGAAEEQWSSSGSFDLAPSTSSGASLRMTPLWESSICSPFLAPFVWPCPWPLSLDVLNGAAQRVLGTHDFTTFAAAPASPDDAPATYVRTITHSCWHAEGELVFYRVCANGFLHHMVRNLVGTFVQCGAGRRDPASIPVLLAACNRALSGPTAPPAGLFLMSVDYPPVDLLAAQHGSTFEDEAIADNHQPATDN